MRDYNTHEEVAYWKRAGEVGHRIPAHVLYPHWRKAEQEALERQLRAAIRRDDAENGRKST